MKKFRMPRRTVREVRETAIATRLLYDLNGKPKAMIRVGAPFEEEVDRWYCPIHIEGLDIRRVQFGGGTDGISALENVFIALKSLLRKWEGKLSWFTEEPGYIGIPTLITNGWGWHVQKKLERVHEREKKRLVAIEIRKAEAKRDRDWRRWLADEKKEKRIATARRKGAQRKHRT